MKKECDKIQELLPAYLEGDLDSSKKSEVQTHLALCPPCQEEARLFSATWNLIGVLPSPEASSEFRVRFWERVRQEEEKEEKWVVFPLRRFVPAFAGALGIWILGIGLGTFVFFRSPLTPGSLPQTSFTWTHGEDSPSFEKAYLRRGRVYQEEKR